MSKALLVVGSAPCLYEDLAKARELYPDHEVMLLNGACTCVKDAQHVLAGHVDQSEYIAACRREKFPTAKPWRLHATWVPHRYRRPATPVDQYPSVTDWHTPWVNTRATSAGKAIRIGMKLGFDPIILCGCPMDGRGYTPDEAVFPREPSCQRIGDPTKQNRRLIQMYRDSMKLLAETEFKGRAFSMCGYTREVLGAPPGC